MKRIRYVRVYSDTAGESRLSEGSTRTRLTAFAPPAPPLELSELIPAHRFGFLVMEEGWHGNWHPAPRRQFLIVLAGRIECRVTKGRKRILRSGDILLLEDTTGKGHIIRSLSGDALFAVVQLARPVS